MSDARRNQALPSSIHDASLHDLVMHDETVQAAKEIGVDPKALRDFLDRSAQSVLGEPRMAQMGKWSLEEVAKSMGQLGVDLDALRDFLGANAQSVLGEPIEMNTERAARLAVVTAIESAIVQLNQRNVGAGIEILKTALNVHDRIMDRV